MKRMMCILAVLLSFTIIPFTGYVVEAGDPAPTWQGRDPFLIAVITGCREILQC